MHTVLPEQYRRDRTASKSRSGSQFQTTSVKRMRSGKVRSGLGIVLPVRGDSGYVRKRVWPIMQLQGEGDQDTTAAVIGRRQGPGSRSGVKMASLREFRMS